MADKPELLKQGDVIEVGTGWHARSYDVKNKTLAVTAIPVSILRLNNTMRGVFQRFCAVSTYGLEAGNRLLVTKTELKGSWICNETRNVYPDGHHIEAMTLKNNRPDFDGIRVEFYQTGCFTCMVPHPKRVGVMPVKYGKLKLDK